MQNIHPEFTSSLVFGLSQHLQLKEMTANYFIGKYIYVQGRINISHSGQPEMNIQYSFGCDNIKFFALCFKNGIFLMLLLEEKKTISKCVDLAI